MYDIMADLELLSVLPNAVILSIGAVAFDEEGIINTNGFYAKVDPVDCMKQGLEVDAETVAWWMQQPDELRLDMFGRDTFRSGLPLREALSNFSDWLGLNGDGTIWVRGPDCDITILANAYRTVDMEIPWDFWCTRDLRTLEDAAWMGDSYFRPDRSSPKHHALHDAVYQAQCAVAAMKALS